MDFQFTSNCQNHTIIYILRKKYLPSFKWKNIFVELDDACVTILKCFNKNTNTVMGGIHLKTKLQIFNNLEILQKRGGVCSG